jgi:hypothetical protein
VSIRIGTICCRLECNDETLISEWRNRYSAHLTDDYADLTIRLEPVQELKPDEVDSAIAALRFVHRGHGFAEVTGLIEGHHDLDRRVVVMRGDKALLNPDLQFNAMNRLLCMAYYTACKIKYDGNPPACLVHSCGIARNGSALLFSGPSDAGKTTIAGLCSAEHGEVLNDEAMLVTRPGTDGAKLWAQGTPMIGGHPSSSSQRLPLSCVLLLKKSARAAARRLDRVEAYVRFMRQILNPAYIGQQGGRQVYAQIAQFSDEITAAVPFYELEFSIDESFWSTIAELDETLGKGIEPNGHTTTTLG